MTSSIEALTIALVLIVLAIASLAIPEAMAERVDALVQAFERKIAASLDGRTVKIAKHHHLDETVEPETVARTVSAKDEAAIRAAVAAHVPAADGPLAQAKTCLYTVTPDHDFIIDLAPGAPNVVVASACSGHGFKFAPVMGEILADLATEGDTGHDISRFRLSRFAPAVTRP